MDNLKLNYRNIEKKFLNSRTFSEKEMYKKLLKKIHSDILEFKLMNQEVQRLEGRNQF